MTRRTHPHHAHAHAQAQAQVLLEKPPAGARNPLFSLLVPAGLTLLVVAIEKLMF